MKTLGNLLRFIVAITLILAVSWCVLFPGMIVEILDTVKERYQTKEEAQANRLFERGWLPVIIPESSSDIHVNNNLDTNTSFGSFSFNPKEFNEFVQRIKISSKQDTQLIMEHPRMKILSDKKYMSLYFLDHGTVWRFFIHPNNGYCEYWMRSI